MAITSKSIALLTTALALSLILPTGPTLPRSASALGTTSPPTSTTISSSIFFTDPNLNTLPLDAQSHPRVNATIARSQHCTGYTGKKHACQNPRTYYTVQNTNPAQLIAWINVTNISGTALRSLRLNETLPADWAVTPPWTTGGIAIRLYYANTTRLNTNPEITSTNPETTQLYTISVFTRTPQVIRIAIPDFNTTAIGHPLVLGRSILASVRLTYTPVGVGQSSVSYPKNYTDTAATAVWTQASYTGTESAKNASAFFITYGFDSTPVNAPPRPFLDTVLSIFDSGISVAIIFVIGFAAVWLSRRRKRSNWHPTSMPQH